MVTGNSDFERAMNGEPKEAAKITLSQDSTPDPEAQRVLREQQEQAQLAAEADTLAARLTQAEQALDQVQTAFERQGNQGKLADINDLRGRIADARAQLKSPSLTPTALTSLNTLVGQVTTDTGALRLDEQDQAAQVVLQTGMKIVTGTAAAAVAIGNGFGNGISNLVSGLNPLSGQNAEVLQTELAAIGNAVKGIPGDVADRLEKTFGGSLSEYGRAVAKHSGYQVESAQPESPGEVTLLARAESPTVGIPKMAPAQGQGASIGGRA